MYLIKHKRYKIEIKKSSFMLHKIIYILIKQFLCLNKINNIAA